MIGYAIAPNFIKKVNITTNKKEVSSCGSSKITRDGLSSSNIPQLKKLSEYEQVCNGDIISQVSIFRSIPTTTDEAESYASEVALILKEFSKNEVKPLIFLEPTTSSGGKISMLSFGNGDYDAVLDTYFSTIKNYQITDDMMGTWIPFPESNIPVWSTVNPDVFAKCVTKMISAQKKYFPDSLASIMLDTITYPIDDSWAGGQAISFKSYLQNIPNGIIDSFGIQGFPYADRASEGGENNGGVTDYIKMSLAIEAADYLGIKSIWINTGTYATKYTGSNDEITTTSESRLKILKEVIAEAENTKNQGYDIAIHLFAEDKSETEEATDWSYWKNGDYSQNSSTNVFVKFAQLTQQSDIELWLYDS